MGKGPKDPERAEKLSMLAAAFFAVRLFRQPPDGDEERGNMAQQAAWDAAALLDKLDKLP